MSEPRSIDLSPPTRELYSALDKAVSEGRLEAKARFEFATQRSSFQTILDSCRSRGVGQELVNLLEQYMDDARGDTLNEQQDQTQRELLLSWARDAALTDAPSQSSTGEGTSKASLLIEAQTALPDTFRLSICEQLQERLNALLSAEEEPQEPSIRGPA